MFTHIFAKVDYLMIWENNFFCQKLSINTLAKQSLLIAKSLTFK